MYIPAWKLKHSVVHYDIISAKHELLHTICCLAPSSDRPLAMLSPLPGGHSQEANASQKRTPLAPPPSHPPQTQMKLGAALLDLSG
jgi:hypothetical protein